MDILEMFGDGLVFLDGAMGTQLHKKGLRPGELPETWNIERPDDVTDIHLSYFNAGSNIVCANTFGANLLKYPDGGSYTLEQIIYSLGGNRPAASLHSPLFTFHSPHSSTDH